MKSLSFLFLLPLVCLGLMACPYKSEFPVTAPEGPPDSRFAGRWKETGKASYYRVSFDEDNVMLVRDGLPGATDVVKYRAWVSDVDSLRFMNIHSLAEAISSPDDTAYYIFTIDTLTNTLCTLRGLDKNVLIAPYDAKDLRRQLLKVSGRRDAYPASGMIRFTKLPD